MWFWCIARELYIVFDLVEIYTVVQPLYVVMAYTAKNFKNAKLVILEFEVLSNLQAWQNQMNLNIHV